MLADGSTNKAEALLLSCMDLRMIDETAWLMGELKLLNKYDHIAVAGASLGVLTASFKEKGKRDATDIRHFGKTFWTHIDLAIALHEIERVVIVEHADCGAYKHFLQSGVLEGHGGSVVKPPRDASLAKKTEDLGVEYHQHMWYANALGDAVRAAYGNVYEPEGTKGRGLEVDMYMVTPWRNLKKLGLMKP